MHTRKLLIGWASTGACALSLGVAAVPAQAQLRTLSVTLLGGKTIQVQVDVPPGTPLDQIALPGITTPIISIADSGAAPAPAPPAVPPADQAPDPGAPADAPAVAKAKDGKQSTTGHRVRKPQVKADGGVVGDVVKKARRPRRATRLRLADGVPRADNPTFSFALPGPAPIGVPNFFIEKFRIPPFLLSIYQAAGIQYGIRWEVLAAINEIETDYGRNLNVSSAGAVGWMQFLPSTFKRYGVDANDDGTKDPYNPVDAIFSAARYLKAAGGDKDVRKAVFAYNHADWYVASVLMRARLIGGLPADLVGSLSGLTQGHFPVHAAARYADDLSEQAATRRVAKGHNASIPVASTTSRRSINIFAKAGSPAISVQDGKITAIGQNPRLGRYVQLRDVYGNTYTYSGLKKLATAIPVPKAQALTKKQAAGTLDLPKPDPTPTAPASAGSQAQHSVSSIVAAAKAKAGPRSAAQPSASTSASVTKERLFAHPSRPSAFKAGGEDQLLNKQLDAPGTTLKSYFTEAYGLKRSDVTIKKLRRGSKVIAGTILGRLGVTSARVAPHVRFEIRPAGRGAPRIDPKPILDGWKLLESTAVYRAAGKNPFFGPDAKNPSIGQVLLMSKEALQARVLADPRVEIYPSGRQDIQAGSIDRRVLATIEFLTASGLKPTITSLRSGHSILAASGNVSEHSTGTAVDVAKINGIPILGHQGPGSIADITIRRLLTLQGTMKPHQIISLMTFQGADNTLSLPDHADHIHIGFRPLYDATTKLGKQLDSVLKPNQWIKLINRIGTIENPNVLTTPSKYSIRQTAARTSRAPAKARVARTLRASRKHRGAR